MKTFSELKSGDKVFEIFPDNSFGIYEISEIEEMETLTKSFIRFNIIKIINSKRDWKYFTVTLYSINESNYHSTWFRSILFANEEDFLVELQKR